MGQENFGHTKQITEVHEKCWIFKYLDAVHPEKLKHYKNVNEITTTILESYKLPEWPILNEVILKVFTKTQDKILNDNLNESSKWYFKRLDFKKEKPPTSPSKCSRGKNLRLLEFYCSVCEDLHILTNKLVQFFVTQHFASMKNSFWFEDQNLETVSIKQIRKKVFLMKQKVDKVKKKICYSAGENIIIDHLRKECDAILEKLITIITNFHTEGKNSWMDRLKNFHKKIRESKDLH